MRSNPFFSFAPVLILFLFGCASDPQINLIHVHEAEVYSDPNSVFYSNDNLRDVSAATVMQSKIKLPSKVKIAVIKLQVDDDPDDYRSFQIKRDISAHSKNQTSDFLLDLLNEAPENFRRHEFSSFLVPKSLIPNVATVKSIQILGTTLHADLVLVIDSRNDKFREKEVVKQTEVLSTASADTYLIDMRTGVILSSHTYTRDSFLQKSNEDLTVYNTLDRARSVGEKKIFKKLVSDMRDEVDNVR
jgi:hypothetical protein